MLTDCTLNFLCVFVVLLLINIRKTMIDPRRALSKKKISTYDIRDPATLQKLFARVPFRSDVVVNGCLKVDPVSVSRRILSDSEVFFEILNKTHRYTYILIYNYIYILDKVVAARVTDPKK